jgi:hypothetical protein
MSEANPTMTLIRNLIFNRIDLPLSFRLMMFDELIQLGTITPFVT